MKPHAIDRCHRALPWLPFLIGLPGCANITGLDAKSQYACQAPEGVRCQSVSGTYHNSLANNLPSQRQGRARADGQVPGGPAGPPGHAAPAAQGPLVQGPDRPGGGPPTTAAASSLAPTGVSYASVPLRSPARVLGLWIKPWRDADGDLVDESRVYLQVDAGQWLVPHVQRRIRQAYGPVRAPARQAAGPAAPAASWGSPTSSALVPSQTAQRPLTEAIRQLQGTRGHQGPQGSEGIKGTDGSPAGLPDRADEDEGGASGSAPLPLTP